MKEADIVRAIMKYLKSVPGCFAWKEHGGMYGTAGIPDVITQNRADTIIVISVNGGEKTEPVGAGQIFFKQEIIGKCWLA